MGDDWLLVGLAVAAVLVFASLLLRSRDLGEVTWIVTTTRHTSPPGVVRVLVELSSAGGRTATRAAVWTRPHLTGPSLELALSTVPPGHVASVSVDVSATEWESTWLEIHWQSGRALDRDQTTSYHLATRTPPCAGVPSSG